jgi:hypothetical protein
MAVSVLERTKQIAARILRGKPAQHRGEPPEPDTGASPCYPGQDVVAIHYSPSRRWRLIVTRDQQRATFRVHREFWDTMDWADWGHAFWCSERGGSIHFCDTQERAEELAIIELEGQE